MTRVYFVTIFFLIVLLLLCENEVLPFDSNNKYQDENFLSNAYNDYGLQYLKNMNDNKQFFKNDNFFEKRKFESNDYESFVPIAKPSWAGIGGVWGKRSSNQNLEYRNNLMFQKLFG